MIRSFSRAGSNLRKALKFHDNSPRFASTLVVSEHDGSNVSASTLSAITAAKRIGADISLLVMGQGVDKVVESAAKIEGVTKVLAVDDESLKQPVAENVSPVVQELSDNYSHILAPSSNHGKNFMPRVAALCDSAPLSDVISVVDEMTFQRPMYAGNAISTVKMSDAKKFILIRPTAFDKASTEGGSASVESVKSSSLTKSSTVFKAAKGASSDRPDLTTSRVVIAGGRGMKSAENFSMLDELANKLGGAVGASRAAVDAGFAPNDYQVGQTGKVVAPDLYIAAGISGAIQHLSGMKDSKTIVAINKDKEAPIFQVADYGLVEDLFKAVPDITNKV